MKKANSTSGIYSPETLAAIKGLRQINYRPMLTHETVHRLEVKLFPEFRGRNFLDICTTDGYYSVFLPSWHFKTKVMTSEMVEDLRANRTKRLLSVGAGPAYLEIFLTCLGIKHKQIELADIHPSNLPECFRKHYLDMHHDWPTLGTTYDYIIFPESILLNVKRTDEERIDALYGLLNKCLLILKKGGEIHMNGLTMLGICKEAVGMITSFKIETSYVFVGNNVFSGFIVVKK